MRCYGSKILTDTIDHLSECARLRDEVVDGVCGDPDHGGEAHADAHGLGPLGVGVVLAVPHRLVREDVEYEDSLQKVIEQMEKTLT